MNPNYNEGAGAATMDRPKQSTSQSQSQSQSQSESQTLARENLGGQDKAQMMRKAEEAGRPGPEHKALEMLVGDWKAEVKCWMEPDGAPQVSQATAKVSWTMNGRFLQEDFSGEMMGKPFQGRTVIGFDNVKRIYQSVWVSDMQTSMFVTEGFGENDTITLEGTSSCGATGQTDMPMKVVLRTISPDKRTFEMFDTSRGSDVRTMEITYTRT